MGFFAGMEKSTDGGASWESLPLPAGTSWPNSTLVLSIAVDPGNAAVYYASWRKWEVIGERKLTTRLLKSRDGGETVQEVDLPGGNLLVDPGNSSHVILYGSSDIYTDNKCLLIESEDAGTTWRTTATFPDNTGPVNVLIIDQNDPNVYYAGTTGAGVMRYERPPPPPPGRAPVVRVF